jgi:carboxylesterase type B
LVAAQGQLFPLNTEFLGKGEFTGLLNWAPQVDGKLVPIQPNEAQITNPVIAGTNRNEGSLFITLPGNLPPVGYTNFLNGLFGATDAKAIMALPRYRSQPTDNRPQMAKIVNDYLFSCATRHVLSASKGRAFSYLFAHKPSFAVWPGQFIPLPCQPVADGGQGEVCHSFELPYVFRNSVAVNTPATPTGGVPPGDSFTPEERPLINWLTEYWTSFAAIGRPSSPSVATPWPPFRSNGIRQVLNLKISQTQDPGLNCGFWDAMGYDKGANLSQYSSKPL